MNQDCFHLFVYGTLRDGSVNHMAHFLKQNAYLIGDATIFAKLYKITWYPAIVLDESQQNKVIGEIYELPFALKEAILHELDGYEGIYDTNEQSDEYERVVTKATMEDGKEVDCYVYNYKASVETCEWIESGDFITYLSRNRR